MKKEIVVQQNKYNFFLFEEFNIWRCIENSNFIHGFEIDLEIESEHFEWSDIENFIIFINDNPPLKLKNIESSKCVLKQYFKEVYKENSIINERIDFKLVSIIYKGFCKNINLLYGKPKYKNIPSKPKDIARDTLSIKGNKIAEIFIISSFLKNTFLIFVLSGTIKIGLFI